MSAWFPEIAQQEILREANLKTVDVFDEITSTNDHALATIEHYADRLPALIVARSQTKGRGRGTRSWFAADGALTFSLLMGEADIPIAPLAWHRCSIVAGVAMCQTLEQYADDGMVQVKWPNDVYLAGRKVCGILVEKRDQGRPYLCVGIGVNVNNSLEQAPFDVQQRAIALTDVTHQQHFLPEVLLEFLKRFRSLCSENPESFASLLPYWRSHCLLTGRQVEMQQGERTFVGECHGIDAEGALLLETSSGRRALVSGEIVRW
ncbi:biotin--[acetyl-CoA-carboxylase] ligase [Bremerella sp. JC817]|uniref:biotin--[acetyl-CoA-carboxylase] ligase n=1 Tax=Bremerella sp. JC817 TaxID=3231756 RepID=UPI00345AE5F5